MNMKHTESKTGNVQLSWPIKLLLIFIILELSALITLAINDVSEMNATVQAKISDLVNIENLGNIQSVQTRRIGPLTFFKYNYFPRANYQVSAKATQLFGFNPQITCVSGSPSYRCQ